ncbi:NAD(P)H-binding protein [Streptomyces sp. NPDC051016]|uniref:NmrA family NAD(P)-binding protein n=1 Tax=Streptomyces sp. NPDC051016 TaxID=3365638 RepID=UPI0037880AC5
MIVVTGATGNVGREVARLLVDGGARVRALTRDPATATVPPGAEAVAGDLTDPSSLAPVLAGAEALFLLSGYAPEVFAEAQKAGVRRVVLMSGGSAETGDRSNAVARYMIDTEDALRASGLAWTMVRPRMFMTNAFQWLPMIKAGVVRAPWPDVPAAVVDPADIAAVAAKALVTAEHEGRVYPVTGPEALRPGDRVRVLGEVLGREIRYEAQPDDEARAEMLAQMPEQYVDAFFSFYSGGKLDEATVFPSVEEVTGRPPRTFADWARANAARFR